MIDQEARLPLNGATIFLGESQPIVIDLDNLIGAVDRPHEAAMIGGFFRRPSLCEAGGL